MGWTALLLSSWEGRLSVVQYLVQQGADIHLQNKVLVVFIFGLFIILL